MMGRTKIGSAVVSGGNGPIASLRTAMALIARSGLASMAGLTFDGKRDLYAGLGYPRSILPKEYRQRYERGDVGARIVEALPEATWRGGGELVEDEDPNTVTAFEQAWRDLDARLHTWSVFYRADILAGLGRFAILLIGAPGEMETELPRMRKPEDVSYLQTYSEIDVTIEEYDTDTTSPRFGLPTKYRLARTDPSPRQRTRFVHWSRVIHVADRLLDDNVFGQPRLMRVWNRLDDLDKVCGGGAEAFWARAHQGYQLDLDKDISLSPAEEKKLSDEIDEFVHGMRRYARTRGVKMKPFGSDTADISRPIDAILTLISSATGIPKRLLLGSERGELASTQDRNNWNDRINDRRTQYAEPQIVRALVDRLIEHGALPKPKKYEVRWPQMRNLTEDERAEVAVRYATVNEKQGETVITTNEIRDRVLGLDPIEDIEEGDAELAREAIRKRREQERQERSGG